MAVLQLILLLLVLATQVSSYGPSIITRDSTMSTSEGRRISLRCSVSGDPSAVIWKWLDKNMTISVNRTIYFDSDRYYVQNSYVRGGMSWDLVIRIVQSTDTGHYVCMVRPGGAKMVVKLDVTGAEKLPEPVLAKADFTDCCKSKGVEFVCQKYCNTKVTDAYSSMNTKACSVDAKNILQCVADKKNHVACCLRRGIDPSCTQLCVIPADFDMTLTCQAHVSTAMMCYAEGKGTIPSPPSQVSVDSYYDNLAVRWTIPSENAIQVTGYYVMYKKGNDSVFNVSSVASKTYHYTIHTGVTYGTYEVRVVAVAKYGTSVPSVSTFVKQGTGSPNMKENMTVSQCCNDQGISQGCRKLCRDNGFKFLEVKDLVDCASELPIALHCLSGGRNHTPCCLRNGIADYCLPLCGNGGNLPFSWSLSNCYIHLPLIDACRDEGMGKIPSAPHGVTLTQVTDTKAVVTWADNPKSSIRATEYRVIATSQTNTNDKVINKVITKTTILERLKPQTRYSVVVIAANRAGTSMPSPTLVFVTASKTPEVKKQSWTGDFNLTECCESKNTPSYCMKFCNYSLNYDAVLKEHLNDAIRCENYLVPMITCASDGRNHSACCVKGGVTKSCQHFCQIHDRSRFRTEDLICHLQGNAILKCFREGLDTIPGEPENITVNVITESSIELAWDLSQRGAKPDGYEAHYSPLVYAFPRFDTAKTNTTLIVLQDLLPSTTYEIKIIAFNGNGSSVSTKSEIVRTHVSLATTTQGPVIGNSTSTTHAPLPATAKECCYKNVPDKTCLDLCIQATYKKDGTCTKYVFATMACHTEGRNNLGCCLDAWVPSTCAKSCKGQILTAGLETAPCISHFNSVMGCNKMGKDAPKRPEGFKVVSATDQSITIDWMLAKGVTYVIRWQKMSDGTTPDGIVNSYTVQLPPYKIPGLTPLTRYRIEMLAKNEFGLSQPTSTRLAWTEATGATIMIKTYPDKKVFDLGSKVDLKCGLQTFTQQMYSYSWYRYSLSHTISTTNTLTIDKLVQHDGGLYTCIVKSGSSNSSSYSKTYYLHVRGVPRVISVTNDRVPLYSPAILTCKFGGFPDQVIWTKNGTNVTPKIDIVTDEFSPVTKSTYEIRSPTESAFGSYVCNGSNRFDYAVGHVTLTRLDVSTTVRPTTIGPSTTPYPTLPDDVLECCKTLKVPRECQRSCSLNLDISVILRGVNNSQCLGHLGNLIRCAAAERNLTQCCSSRGVPEICHSFCHGTTPVDILRDPAKLKCLASAETIFQCLEDGRKLVPTPPLGMAATYVFSTDNIKVTWQPPARVGSGVEVYILQYSVNGQHKQYTMTDRHFLMHSVLPNAMYKIWVMAKNMHGHSHSSRVILVNTTAGGSSVIVGTTAKPKPVPATPIVKWKVTKMVYITVGWSIPVTSPPFDYIVIGHKEVNEKHYTTTKLLDVKNKLEHTVGPLQPGSEYLIYVGVGNRYGESRSDAVSVHTRGKKGKPLPSRQGSGLKVGLGVGITLVIVAVLVGLGLFYYLRIRQKSPQERVTFENPSYSDTSQPVKISGLPAHQESVKKQFQYDTLAEDKEVEYTNLQFTSPDTSAIVDNNNSSKA